MKAASITFAALIGITGCNRDAKEGGKESGAESAAKEAIKDASEAGKSAVNKVEEQAKETGKDIGDAAEKAVTKTGEVASGVTKDVGEAFAGDKGKTEADKALTKSIRTALKSDTSVAKEAKDIDIGTEKGVVKLTGTVTSAEAKRDIVRVAGKAAAGKARIQDEIKVAERVGAGGSE